MIACLVDLGSRSQPQRIEAPPQDNQTLSLAPPRSFVRNVRTFMHMQSENGSVAMMSRMETSASRRAQQPGPSGSAARESEKLFQLREAKKKVWISA